MGKLKLFKRHLSTSHGILESILKVHSTTSSPDRALPWQNGPNSQSSGSAFAISGNRIITNAHVVADSSFVTVTKHGLGTHFQAKVVAIGNDCDLAMLEVIDPTFGDVPALQLAETPSLQDSVTVVGYPTGGETISVTKGIVSRVELVHYAHSAFKLLGIQIDAAINPGNSGGPAFLDDEVIGVAFQNMPDAENIGYIIPNLVVKHFLEDIGRFGKSVGFPGLGVVFQHLPDTKAMHRFFNLDVQENGVVITRVWPKTPADGFLKPHDIILEIDGHKIGNDGQVTFRDRERIALEWLVLRKHKGDTVDVTIWREGAKQVINFPVEPLSHVVPIQLYDQQSPYFIFGGLTFQTLSQPYLHTWGDDWYNNAPRPLVAKAVTDNHPNDGAKEYVFMSAVLPHAVNMGASKFKNLILEKIGDVEIVNLKHAKEIIDQRIREQTPLIDFHFSRNRLLVLDCIEAAAADEELLQRHRIGQKCLIQ